MTTADVIPARPQAEVGPRTAYLIVDTESVPDGELVAKVKYPGERLSPDDAIARAQAEARDKSWTGSDFLPVTFQVPVAVCVLRVGADFGLQKITCLDAPLFRPAEVVKKFWKGISQLDARLVTFNGRGFDIPLLELAAYRERIDISNHLQKTRHRYNGGLDLLEFFANHGACRLVGGLNLLAKMIGLPGKMDVTGEQVYEMYRRGDLPGINDYCLCDTLDTYFVFLRTRVMTGEIDPDDEERRSAEAREFLEGQTIEYPVLARYLEAWAR